jgi:hypothetical protein
MFICNDIYILYKLEKKRKEKKAEKAIEFMKVN